jgi:hypothetical protein
MRACRRFIFLSPLNRIIVITDVHLIALVSTKIGLRQMSR